MKKNEKTKLVRSYAEALYEVAEARGVSEKVFGETLKLVDEFNEDPQIMKYLTNPILSNDDKESVLSVVAKKQKLSQPMCGLFKTMAKNGRSGVLFYVLQDFKDIFYRKKNICPVQVKTVIDLTETQKKKLISALEKYTGKKVVVDYQIKPEILGGLLVECNSKIIDDSIKGKIDRLMMLMKGAV